MHHPDFYDIPVPRFLLGRTVITRNAQSRLPDEEVQAALHRHHHGDWGDLDEHDLQVNEQALLDGDRLHSSYRTKAGIKFWIITEADRSVTTILLPEDY